MNSQIFFWLGGIGSIALIVALMIPFRKYYFEMWKPLQSVLTAVAIGVGIVAFSAWTTAFLSPQGISDKVFIVRWAVDSVILLTIYYASLCLITLKRGGPWGYNVSAVILAAVEFSLFLLGFIRSNGMISTKISSVIFGAVYGAGYIAIVCFFAFSSKTEEPVVKDFYIRDTLPEGNGQKVKVILLNGQSNAEGVSRVEYLKKHVSEEDFVRYTSGYKNVMINYFNYNGKTSSGGAFEYLSAGEGCEPDRSFYGPELGLADLLSRHYPDETVYIIKYAWGGSNLHTQWLSPSSKGKTGDLYQAFVRFTKACLSYLKKKNYDPEIYAMCWMQGESDSFQPAAASYGERSKNLVRDVRKEFSDYASEKGIYFLDAAISDSPHWLLYDKINSAKEKNASEEEKYIYLDTIAAGLEYQNEPVEQPDKAHYDSMGMIKLGEMFAEEVIKIID